jgi:hypothetical protein
MGARRVPQSAQAKSPASGDQIRKKSVMNEFFVEVTRISYARQTLKIDAESVSQAKGLAMKRAPDEEFSTYECEYEVSSVEAATSGSYK